MNLCTKKSNIIVTHARENFKLIRVKARAGKGIEENQKEQLRRERLARYMDPISIFFIANNSYHTPLTS